MKRALITGASSYLGNKLAARLASSGIDVHALVRPQADPARLPACIAADRRHPHDGSTESMIAVVAKAAPDATFHLAGLYIREPKPADVVPLITSNYTIGIQLLEALCRRGPEAKVISAGTYSQYFMSDRPRPLDLYSAAKQAFHDALALYADRNGFRTVTLVLFDSFGADDPRAKLLKAIVDAALNGTELPLPDEDITVDLIHIDDVTAAFVRAADLLENDPTAVAAGTFAVGYGRRYRLSEVVALFERVTGLPVATRPGGYELPRRRIIVPWDGPRLPGWQPAVTLEDGFRQYLAARR